MIKMSPDLIFDLRHALVESRDANNEIAKFLRQQCTGGDPLARLCPNCATAVAAHESCANDASNFLSQIQADLDRDKIDRNGSPFSSRAAADLAGISRRTEFPQGRYGEDAALDEALGNLHRSTLGATRNQERVRDGLREFADGGKAADPAQYRSHAGSRDNLVIGVQITEEMVGGGQQLIISDHAAYLLRNYLFPSDGK